jgi:UDP-N-acetylglucosamine 2-epimerase
VVLVGDRQESRECAENVLKVACERIAIFEAIKSQTEHGRYAPSQLYGDGDASRRIAEHLASVTPYIQKHLGYVVRA